jgi:hypothetical protein
VIDRRSVEEEVYLFKLRKVLSRMTLDDRTLILYLFRKLRVIVGCKLNRIIAVSGGFKNFEVTVFAEKFDSNAYSVPADKKISRGISETQIFDANFIQIQRQAGV